MNSHRPSRSKPSRRRHILFPMMAFLWVGLMGCVADMPSPPKSDRFLVEPVRLSHQVLFANGAEKLGAAEQDQLEAFLDAADPDGRAALYLNALGPEQKGRIYAVASALVELGRDTSGTGGAKGTRQGVMVTLVEDVFLPEACLGGGDWPKPHLPPAGCTQALALVQMVEDPNDLLRGREMGPALSATAARAAIRHFRLGMPAPVEQPPAGSAPEALLELPPIRGSGY